MKPLNTAMITNFSEKENTMHEGLVFISAFNCEQHVAACLGSLAKQSNQDFSILYIDDASTDNTANTAERLLAYYFPGRYILQKNQVNQGKAANAFLHLGQITSTYVAILDGDDQLIDDVILDIFSKEYANNCDVVYSNYKTTDGRSGHCRPLDPLTSPRTQGWRSSHFFSFRTTLFHNIPETYFKNEKGDWIRSACDITIAIPILDQTRRYKYIPRQAYLYTSDSPHNHHNKNGPSNNLSSPEQQKNAALVMGKAALACIHPLEGSGVPFDSFIVERLEKIERKTAQVQAQQSRSFEEHLTAAAVNKLAICENIPLTWLQGSGGWAIECRVYEFLLEILDTIEKPSILEFGSGTGSKILHKLALNRGGHCTSVEHDEEWYARSCAALSKSQLLRENSVVYAPLVEVNVFGIDTKFYDMSWLSEDTKFDLIIVDGPPQATSALSRLAAFPLVSRNLGSDFHIVLDDFERPAEKKIAEIWKSITPELAYEEFKFNKSICVISRSHLAALGEPETARISGV
jgi:hypothetical protein